MKIRSDWRFSMMGHATKEAVRERDGEATKPGYWRPW